LECGEGICMIRGSINEAARSDFYLLSP